VISQTVHTLLFGAVDTAENFVVGLHAVTDDARPAMLTLGRQNTNGALETIEDVLFASNCDTKAVRILISAVFTLSHGLSS
jgi:hypothetical protein